MPSDLENRPLPIMISLDQHTIMCIATCFGYDDPGDDGKGAWGDDNNNTTTVGVSVPPPILLATLGSLAEHTVHSHTATVVCNGRQVKNVRITDDGPGERIDGVWHLLWSRSANQGHLLDFTYGLCHLLGVKYDARSGSFKAGYWIEDSQGNPLVPKGLDAPRYYIT